MVSLIRPRFEFWVPFAVSRTILCPILPDVTRSLPLHRWSDSPVTQSTQEVRYPIEPRLV